MTIESIIEIPLDRVVESPKNPRTHFDPEYLAELATDIKSHGRVLQPIVVREVPDPTNSQAMVAQIVFGHCRARATRMAGFDSIPAIVRQMTDLEVQRAQISENLQRRNVHPIEEAEGFAALIKDHGLTVEQLVKETGKKRTYVYDRLKLLQACPEVRKACLAGEIGSEVALLVARVGHHKLQSKALAAIKSKYIKLEDGGAMSYRETRDLLNEKFTLGLKGAIFDSTDETLCPNAGSCTACPKRSENDPSFADIIKDTLGNKHGHGSIKNVGPDVCTDPDCFEDKRKAHLAREAKYLESRKETVITGSKARSAVDAYGGVKGAYVALKDVKQEIEKARRAAQLDPKIVPPLIVTIQNPRDGSLIKAVARADLKAAGIPMEEVKSSGRSSHDWMATHREEQKANEAAAAKETPLRLAVLSKMRVAMSNHPRTTNELRLVVAKLWNSGQGDGVRENINRHYGLKINSYNDADAGDFESLTADELGRLAVELTFISESIAHAHNHERKPKRMNALAAVYGIDVKAVRAEVRKQAELDQATEAQSTPAPAARAPKGAGGKAKKVAKPKAAAGADTPDPAGAGAVDTKTLPLALEGGSMHSAISIVRNTRANPTGELSPQAAWPFPKPKDRPAAQEQTDEAASPQIQTDDAATPLHAGA